jgi:hypothetical protein
MLASRAASLLCLCKYINISTRRTLLKYVPIYILTMATERRADSTSEADSHERTTATAFLSDRIEEDSLLFSAAHQPHPHRPFSPSVPDLPSPSGMLRRRSAFSNDGSTNNNAAINSLLNSLRTSTSLTSLIMFHEHQNHQPQPQPSVPDLPSPSGTLLRRRSAFSNDDGTNYDEAINSLANSLRTSLMFHEQHQEDQNRPSQTQMSPSCCIGAVLCEEPTSAVGGSILPLPFGVRPSPVQQPALVRDHLHQQGGASSVRLRSASAGPFLRSTKGRRYVPCSSAFRRSRST